MHAYRIAAISIAFLTLLGCSTSNDRQYQGWVEGDLIFVAPDESGRLELLSVRVGQKAETGIPLFSMDTELHVADVEALEAALVNARLDMERAQKLLATASGARTTVEDTEALFRTARARLNSAQTKLARRKMVSPVNGLVQQIYQRQGEYVPAGRAVLSLLPLDHVKIRFYVPETVLASIEIGDDVSIHCDGCKQDFPGKVTFMSQTSEFTPPVIFSLEERSKLVYLIEAHTGIPAGLRVGQPVDVRLMGKPK